MAKPVKRSIRVKTSKNVSLGSCLDEVGFKPLGRRIKIKAGIDQPPLNKPRSTPATEKPAD
ncbi:Hypothetical protein NGAL_HAMBI1146_00330 [Neorhizobium galegae bv. officinalis]|nr:Hypothetical protein NGAL_HAMBI1146_00330 [Neorhizobium galegae bv. officinalis]